LLAAAARILSSRGFSGAFIDDGRARFPGKYVDPNYLNLTRTLFEEN
jgi:hypothetical protein